MNTHALVANDPLVAFIAIAGIVAVSVVASGLLVMAIGSLTTNRWMAVGLGFMAAVMIMRVIGIILYGQIITVNPYWIINRAVDIGFAIFIIVFATLMHRGGIKRKSE